MCLLVRVAKKTGPTQQQVQVQIVYWYNTRIDVNGCYWNTCTVMFTITQIKPAHGYLDSCPCQCECSLIQVASFGGICSQRAALCHEMGLEIYLPNEHARKCHKLDTGVAYHDFSLAL